MKQLYNLLKCFRTHKDYFKSTDNNIKFVKNLDKLNVFIIEKPVEIDEITMLQIVDQNKKIKDTGLEPLNTPFQMCWFEGFSLGGFPVPSPDFNYQPQEGNLIGFGIQEDSPDYQSIHLYFEHKPQHKITGNMVSVFAYYTHHTFSITQGKLGLGDNRYYELFLLCYMLIKILLLPLIRKQDCVFTEPTQEVRFKDRVGGEYINIKNKPHNYIYITDKPREFAQHHQRIRTLSKPEHQWEVMGHWRRIRPESFGKDREGKRIVKGFTWIRPFVKGPEDTILVKKVRKVTGPCHYDYNGECNKEHLRILKENKDK